MGQQQSDQAESKTCHEPPSSEPDLTSSSSTFSMDDLPVVVFRPLRRHTRCDEASFWPGEGLGASHDKQISLLKQTVGSNEAHTELPSGHEPRSSGQHSFLLFFFLDAVLQNVVCDAFIDPSRLS